MAADRIALLARVDERRIVERSWGVRWGRSGVAFWRRCEMIGPVPVSGDRTGAAPGGGRSGWIAAGVVALGSAGLTAAGVTAGPALPRPQRQALVSIAVPPAKPFGAKPEGPSRKAAGAVAGVTPVSASASAAMQVPVDKPQEPAVEIGEEGAAEPSFTRRMDALAAALSTGRLQSWTEPEAGVRGYVVVGEAQAEPDRTCREVSVLLKSDGGNSVERFRRCIGGSDIG